MKPFTDEQSKWLIDHYWDYKYVRLLKDEFNKVYGENRTTDTIKHKCRRLGLSRGRLFSEEQDKWIADNINLYSRKELTKAFNDKFSQNRTEDVLKVHCNRELGLKFSDNKERLSDLQSNRQKEPIGTIKIFSQGEKKRAYIKVRDEKHAGFSNYKSYAVHLFEQSNGKLQDDYCVIFLDGDTMNVALENLYAVSKKAHRLYSLMSRYIKGITEDTELKKTALMYCELVTSAKGRLCMQRGGLEYDHKRQD